MTILGFIFDKSPVDIAEGLSICLSHERGKSYTQIIVNMIDLSLTKYTTIISVLPERRM